ncbi:LamG-like jellyroll fold domain-containing protein [Longimonas halophila]|uniref:LamG-like jellyroll fold domain-containing protein n=1 Tax=Longimonas halophila TaxID=1469170 RepID=UPI001596FFEB|nr:LamG-like jellyroll fold domain-containing protein [Longimonas halophila]
MPVLAAAVLLLAGGFASSVQAQTVYHVTEDGTGDGSSWSNATSLSDALSTATGSDAIVIATGRYLPTDDATNRSARFTIDGSQDGLAVYGGWNGSETFTGVADVESQLDSRDLEANPTVLSGDIDNNDATNSDGITETASDISGGNSNTVLYLDGSTGGTITSSTVVDGVTLTGGQESGTADLPTPERSGGGAYCDGQGAGNECSPTFQNVNFIGNSADLGAGLLNNGFESGTSSPQLQRVIFRQNDGAAALYNLGAESGRSAPVITDGLFDSNSERAVFNNADSGGTSSPTFSRTTFRNNSTDSDGAALYNTNDEAGTARPVLTNVVFANNTADFNGGAIYNTPSIDGTLNLQITNGLFVNNSARSAGAIFLRFGNHTFTNVAFVGNSAEQDAGAIYDDGAETDIVNSILWGNTASDEGASIYTLSSTTELRHTLIEGGLDGPKVGGLNDLVDGGNNLSDAPRFSNINDPVGPDNVFGTTDDGLRVQLESPALDVGDDSALPSGVTTDLLGANRIQDSNSDGTAAVSLGPYEEGVPGANLRLAAQPAEETARFTLANRGTAGVTDAEVDLGLPAGVSASSPSGAGTVSSGAWTVDVPAEDSVSVTVSLTRDESAENGLLTSTAQLDLESYTVSEGGTDSTRPEDAEADWTLLEPPYGSGTALALDRDIETYLRADAVSSALADEAFTMEAWVRPTGTNDQAEGVLSLHDTDGNAQHVLFYEPSGTGDTSTGRFRYDDPDSGSMYSSDAFAAGEWHHVAVVVRDDDSGALYVNGTEEATFTTSTRPASDGRFTVGQAWNGDTASNFFGGSVDEVRLWSTARTETELRTTQHETVDNIQPGLAAYYRLDAAQSNQRRDADFSGTTAYDLARGRNATHVNSPQWTGDSAPLGQESVVVSAGETASVGPTSAELTATSTTARTTLYRYGDPGAAVFTGDAVPFPGGERTNVVWGAVPTGAADLELAYDNVTVPNAAEVGLGARRSPADPWQVRPEDPGGGSVTIPNLEAPGELTLYDSRPRLLYVDESASGAGNGSSWDDAYPELATAFRLSTGNDVIVVAEGRYLPTDDATDPDAAFEIEGAKDGLAVYGGWAGTESFDGPGDVESQLDTRDIDANPVVLSGDIDDNDTTTDGVTETASDISGTNSHTVLHLDGTTGGPITDATVLDGLVITGGQANGASGSASTQGGGAYCDGTGAGNECSPTLENLTFAGNTASDAGGALLNSGTSGGVSSPRITNATFTGNQSGGNGGALLNDGSDGGTSSPPLTNVTFTDNESEGDGGGLLNDGSENGTSSPEITDVTFTGNQSGGGGGALLNDGSDDGTSSPEITDATFTSNESGSDGGALLNDGRDGGTSSPPLTNVTFTDNLSGGDGGAIYSVARTDGTSQLDITDAVFADNIARAKGGAIYSNGESGGTVRLRIDQARFTSNAADRGSTPFFNTGGALSISGADATLEVTETAFHNNYAVGGLGGAIYMSYMDGSTGQLQVDRVTFVGNATNVGGALAATVGTNINSNADIDIDIQNAAFTSNEADFSGGAVRLAATGSNATVTATIANALFADNAAINPDEESLGGAFRINTVDEGTVSTELINTTFATNSADKGGALYARRADASGEFVNVPGGPNEVTFTNSILWGNTASTSGGATYNEGGTVALGYTLIEGGVNGPNTGGNANTNNGNTLDADPLFADATRPPGADDSLRTVDDGLRLQPGSPALNAGDTSALPSGADTDLLGEDRVQGGTVSLGAYERSLYDGPVYHVDADASGTGDGSSFDLALSDLQTALDAATGDDVIVVADGRYLPTSDASGRDARFEISGSQDGLAVYGGWTGTETFTDVSDVKSQLDSRDLRANPTVLSGDINDNDDTNSDGVTETTEDIDGATDVADGENSYTVLYLDGATGGNTITTDTVLDGLTITGGQANMTGNPASLSGGGIFCDGNNSDAPSACSPTIANAVFAGNYASTFGGGLYNNGQFGTSSPHIANTAFTHNASNFSGGAIYNDGTRGGTASPQIETAVFANNVADFNGGAMYNYGGDTTVEGGTSSPSITNTVFVNNTANSGGALYSIGQTGVSSPQITNSTFTGNYADREGGALLNFGDDGTSTPVLTNSILWGNGADINEKRDGGEIRNNSASAILQYTLIEGGVNGDGVGGDPNTDSGNNRDADPQFVDASNPPGDDGRFGTSDDGLRLGAGSPALARGSFAPFATGGIAEALTKDLAGRSRIFGARPDLGAYERTEVETTDTDIADASGLLGYLDPSGFEGLVLLRDNASTTGGLTLTRSNTAPSDPGGELPENVAPFTWTVNSGLDTVPTYDLVINTGSIEGIGDFDALQLYKSDDGGTTWNRVDNLGGTIVRDADRGVVAVQDLTGFSQFALASSEDSNPLPVELAQMEATYDGGEQERVTVQWETRSETNNAGFEVQRRAADGSGSVETSHRGVSTAESWETIAQVDGAGTTDEPQSYRVEDTDLPYAADSLRYRLRQLDADGSATLSDPVTVARNVDQAELLPTYPNPTRSQATVRYAVPERQAVEIALYDVLGRRVRTVTDGRAEGRTEQTMDVSDLASGTYFLRMQTESHTETQRVTVVR